MWLMTGTTDAVWTAPDIDRPAEPLVADERTMLEGWLAWHRTTLLWKCAGLTGEQLAQRSTPPSTLSLLGLVRHMAFVERIWFRQRFRAEPIDDLYWRKDQPDADFAEADPARAQEDFATLQAEWEFADQAVAGASLDDTFTNERHGTVSLRWIYIHMIEEYARHNGHADLLRERIDGTTGD